jgi:hypothetical protein
MAKRMALFNYKGGVSKTTTFNQFVMGNQGIEKKLGF